MTELNLILSLKPNGGNLNGMEKTTYVFMELLKCQVLAGME
jgi:hypothetical protein